MDSIRILIVEDDREISRLAAHYLINEGYSADCASNGLEALDSLGSGNYQLVILDLMIPYVDGYEVLRKIREKANIPVLIISAKSEESDKIIGLGMGADDYLTKPFSFGEMVARVKAQLRRYMSLGNSNLGDSVLRHGTLELDLKSCSVKVDGAEVTLTLKEFEILKLLMMNPKNVFTKSQIFNSVWKEDYISDDNTLMVHIRRLREKIEADPSNPRYLLTVWGIGYKLGEVK